jgi:AraC family transcriptional activator of pobA
LDKSTIKKHTIGDIIKILDEAPQPEGLHMYLNKEAIIENPFSYPFRSDNYGMLLVLSGKIEIQLNLINYTLEANDFIIISPNMVTHIIEIFEDLKIIGISFSVDYVLSNNVNRNSIEAFDFFASKTIPKLSFEKEETEMLLSIAKILHKKNIERKHNFFGNDMVGHTFNLLMFEIASIHKKNNSELKPEMSRKEELTMKFLKILDNNFKRERGVQFYADKLFVTTDHLTKVLKDVAGKTAGKLIDDAVIMEARILLANPSLTIAQIADELQFSDQSFFGKFFKKNTGFSPSYYRKRKTII